MRVLQLWFGIRAPVSRRAYVTSGFGLAGFKYLVEAAAVWALTGRVWTPLDYVVSTGSRYESLGSPGLAWAIAIWSLPFIWIGASMTVRRGIDAGLTGAVGLLVFVPLVNSLTMLVLATQPSRAPASPDREAGDGSAVGSALAAAAAGAVFAAAVVALSVLGLKLYGTALFVGTPFVVGFVAGLLFNLRRPRTLRDTLGLAAATIAVAAGTLLLLALEGVLCLAMALPLGVALALPGAALGRAVALRRRQPLVPLAALLLGLPALLGASALPPPAALPVHEVASSIDIAAPPALVWSNVVGFGELPPPVEWEMRHGIAYPIRARIAGRGVGAVRRCEFSTGAFVEPITVWDPPRRLAFDVTDQPPAMQELSPYAQVRAPHVAGYLRSRRGEFRLAARPDGGTRLEGHTYYTLDVSPGWYWTRYADLIIGRIHMRVLRHIKALSEAASTPEQRPTPASGRPSP
jgi:hypothetical protein